MTALVENLPQALKRWRKGYTQEQAAAILGVKLCTYRSWEGGKLYGSPLTALLGVAVCVDVEDIKRIKKIEIQPKKKIGKK